MDWCQCYDFARNNNREELNCRSGKCNDEGSGALWGCRGSYRLTTIRNCDTIYEIVNGKAVFCYKNDVLDNE